MRKGKIAALVAGLALVCSPALAEWQLFSDYTYQGKHTRGYWTNDNGSTKRFVSLSACEVQAQWLMDMLQWGGADVRTVKCEEIR